MPHHEQLTGGFLSMVCRVGVLLRSISMLSNVRLFCTMIKCRARIPHFSKNQHNPFLLSWSCTVQLACTNMACSTWPHQKRPLFLLRKRLLLVQQRYTFLLCVRPTACTSMYSLRHPSPTPQNNLPAGVHQPEQGTCAGTHITMTVPDTGPLKLLQHELLPIINLSRAHVLARMLRWQCLTLAPPSYCSMYFCQYVACYAQVDACDSKVMTCSVGQPWISGHSSAAS